MNTIFKRTFIVLLCTLLTFTSAQAGADNYNEATMGKKVYLETASWGQNSPFNKQIFTEYGGSTNAKAGCVPTAYAIVMRYHGFPTEGTTKPLYNCQASTYVEITDRVYDFSKMPLTYNSDWTQEQIDEVSKFFSHVLHACFPSSIGIGATTVNEGSDSKVLNDYFNYQLINASYQANFTMEQWIEKIKESIDNGCPIPYASDNSGTGDTRHMFVLDGYTTNNYFHFNFGWNGSGNGWFKLDAITPSQGDNYSWIDGAEHYALFNLAPNKTMRTVTASVSPSGAGTVTVNGSANSAEVMEGTRATLVATANSGYTFSHWSNGGAQVSTEKTYKAPVAAAGNDYVANFLTVGNTRVNVSVSYNSSYGTVTQKNGSTISGTGLTPYQNSEVTLVATPLDGYVFNGWTVKKGTNSTNYAGTELTFVATEDMSVEANFSTAEIDYSVTASTLTKSGNEQGSSSYCSTYTFNGGVAFTLTTTIDDVEAYALTTSDQYIDFYATAHTKNVSDAYPTNIKYTLSAPEGYLIKKYSFDLKSSGTYSINVNYGNNNNVTIDNSGYKTISETNIGKQSVSFILSTDYNRGRAKAYVDNFSITLEKISAEGGEGTVDPTPTTYIINATAGEGGSVTINGDAVSQKSVNKNSTVTLVATPSTGYSFVNWTSGTSPVSTDATYTFTASENTSLVANFEQTRYTVTVAAGVGGSAYIDTKGTTEKTVSYNENVTITAEAASGYSFVEWTDSEGNKISSLQSVSVSVTTNATYTAVFEPVLPITGTEVNATFAGATGFVNQGYTNQVVLPATQTAPAITFSANDAKIGYSTVEGTKHPYLFKGTDFTISVPAPYKIAGYKLTVQGDKFNAGTFTYTVGTQNAAAMRTAASARSNTATATISGTTPLSVVATGLNTSEINIGVGSATAPTAGIIVKELQLDLVQEAQEPEPEYTLGVRITFAQLMSVTKPTHIAVKNLSKTNNWYFAGTTNVENFGNKAVFVWTPKNEGVAGEYYLKTLDGKYLGAAGDNTPISYTEDVANAAVFTTLKPVAGSTGTSQLDKDSDTDSRVDDYNLLVRFMTKYSGGTGDVTTWINVTNTISPNQPKYYNGGYGMYTAHFVYAVSVDGVAPEIPDVLFPDGAYKIYWQADNRGYLAYHATNYPNEAKLAGVTYSGCQNIHYAVNEVDLVWYLITADDGKRYLFQAATGKFLGANPSINENGIANKLSTTEAWPINVEKNTHSTRLGHYIITTVINGTNSLLCSGCGTPKEQHPVRWLTVNDENQKDGGAPLQLIPVNDVTVADNVMNTVLAVINGTDEPEQPTDPLAGKYFRLKEKSTGNYMNIANTNHNDGATSGVTVVAKNESSDTQIFLFEQSGDGYKLKANSGNYIKCHDWNANANTTDAGEATVLTFEPTGNELEYLIKWDNKTTNNGVEREDYFKAENGYVYCDAASSAAATWVLEEVVTQDFSFIVTLTDAEGNNYTHQFSYLPDDVATALTEAYPFITLGNNGKLENSGNTYTYTNTVTLPFKVSNATNTYWHNIYWPDNGNSANEFYPIYLSANAATDTYVTKATEKKHYGESQYNTLAYAEKLSWAVYSVDNTLNFKFKNKLTGKYIKVTSVATADTQNVKYSDEENATAFTLTKNTDANYKGDYAITSVLDGQTGYVCNTAVGYANATNYYDTGHNGAWAKFVEAYDYMSAVSNLNYALDIWFQAGEDDRRVITPEIDNVIKALEADFGDYTLDGTAYQMNGAKTTLNNIKAYAAIVDETHSWPTLALTITPEGSGNVTINGENVKSKRAPEGYTLNIGAVANNGYEFQKWANGTSPVSTYANSTFTMPQGGATLTANFNEVVITPTTYTISVEANPATAGSATVAANATSAGASSLDVAAGGSATLNAEANDGYSFINWTLNGNEVGAETLLTINNISASANYVANFEKDDAGGGTTGKTGYIVSEKFGALTDNGSSKKEEWVFNNEKDPAYPAQLRLNANEAAISVNGTQYRLYGDEDGTTYTLSVPNDYRIVGYKITYEQRLDSYPAAINDSSTSPWVVEGLNTTSTSFTVTGTLGMSAILVTEFIVYIASENCTVSVEVNNNEYGTATVATSATSPGASSVLVNNGGSVILSAEANDGYVFTNWTKNSEIVSTDASCTINNITEDVTFIANFKPATHTVRVSYFYANNGGTATVNGGSYANVEDGGSVLLEAIANPGYELTGWLKDGVLVKNYNEGIGDFEVQGSPFELYNITYDAEYVAVFSKKTEYSDLEDGKAYRIVAIDGNDNKRYIYRNGTELMWKTTEDNTINSIFVVQKKNLAINLISGLGYHGWRAANTLGAEFDAIKLTYATTDDARTLYMDSGTSTGVFTTFANNTVGFRNSAKGFPIVANESESTNFTFVEVPDYAFQVSAADGSNAKLGTVNLPFATTVPEGVKVYGVDYTEGEQVYMAELLTDNVLPANTPVLIEAAASGKYGFKPAPASDDTYDTGFAGTLEAEDIPGTTNAYILSYEGEGTHIMLYKLSSTSRRINANKAYYIDATGKASALKFVLGGTTDIEDMEGENGEVEAIYDLQGRKLSEITEPGMYIINGKKVYKK